MIRSLLVLSAVFLNLTFAQAEPTKSATVADKNGCKVYNPMPQENESISWDGDCIGGFANGKGTLNWYINGELMEYYSGEMRNGWAEGHGIYTSKDGTQYDGEWLKSKQNGLGVQENANGSAYDGEWVEGQPHGQGTYRAPNGQIWEGEWRHGQPLDKPDGRRI
jgi:hypothetical protein